jgi:SAM-dependent methyltransferase
MDASPERLACTRKAYLLLPAMDRPRILDVGCGRGWPTLELARLGRGEVIGVDTDPEVLAVFESRIEELGLSDRVRAVLAPMEVMNFEKESFDIIWAEGSIHIVGFERGLDTLGVFLKREGFLVAHEAAWPRPDPPRDVEEYRQRRFSGIRTVEQYAAVAMQHGFELVDSFFLPEDFWWREYYAPLGRRIGELRERYAGDPRALEELDREQRDVDLCRRYPAWCGSAFLVMRKR